MKSASLPGPSGNPRSQTTSNNPADRRQAIFTTVIAGLLILAALSTYTLSVTPAAAQNTEGPVEGTVELDGDAESDEFETGEEQTLDISITNDGEVTTDGTHPSEIRDRATRAESTDVNITDSPEEIEIRSGEQSAGDIESGETTVESFDIFIEDGADAGEYDLEVTTEYNNVTVEEYEQNDDGDVTSVSESRENESETFTVTVEVDPEPRFEVVETDEHVQVGETGEFTVTMENVGSETAEDVVVTAESTDQDIFFGSGGATSERAVEDWEPGETKSVTFEAGATDEAITEPYPIDLTVEFTDEAGEDGADTELTEIEPAEKQQFIVDDAEHSIPAGDDGLMEVNFTNEGPQDITNASVAIQSNDPEITFSAPDGGTSTTTETFIDDWEAGETETVVLRVAVGADASERNHTLEATIDARDEQDNELNERTREFGFEPDPAQRYTIEDVDHNLTIGDDTAVEIGLKNHGPQNVTEAEVTLLAGDSAVAFEDDSATNTISIGDWDTGETQTVTTRLAASDDAVQTNYTIDAEIDARDENDSELATRDREFAVEPLARQQYAVEDISHDVAVDDDGVLEVEMENHGPLNLTDASVEMGADDPAIVFGSGGSGEAVEFGDTTFEEEAGGSLTSEAFVGDWAVNETKTLRYQMSTTEDALPREYTLEATVGAYDERDEELTDRTREFGFEPHGEQTFAIENAENTLWVGEDGDVTGSVTNEANRTAENVVVLMDTESDTVLPREREYAIGDLEPGETADFDFRVGISEEAEAGPRVFEFETRYRDSGGDPRLDDSQDIFVEVQPERDSFDIEPVSASFEPGDSETVEMELTNNRDEPVENVRAKVFPDSPISSDSDEAFVSELDAGETETAVFDLGVDSDAVAKEYPVSVDVRYDDERGDRQLSGTYEVPVEVTDSDDGGTPIWLFGAVLLAFGGLAVRFRAQLGSAGEQIVRKTRGN